MSNRGRENTPNALAHPRGEGLAERGVVRRDGDGRVLLGDPPDDLDGM